MDANNVVFKAATMASLAHQNKGQAYGSNPYFFHLSLVVGVLQEFGVTDEEVLAAGWLHDIVEDTDYTRDLVTALFGDRISDIVWGCTGLGKNRRARNTCIAEKLVTEELAEAAIVKAADRIANVRASNWTKTSQQEMYAKEMVAFTRVLKEANLHLESGPAATLCRMIAELEK